MLSLFAGKSHVEVVLLDVLHFKATNDSEWLLSICCNALNLFSVEALFFFYNVDIFLLLY